MTESTKDQHVAPAKHEANIELGVGLLDVLMRGLETAKRNLDNNDEGAEPREFCALFYVTSGTMCPVAYLHRPT